MINLLRFPTLGFTLLLLTTGIGCGQSQPNSQPTSTQPPVTPKPEPASNLTPTEQPVPGGIPLEDLAALPVRRLQPFGAAFAPSDRPNTGPNTPPSVRSDPTVAKAPNFTSAPYQVLDEFKEPAFQVSGQQVFKDVALPKVKLDVRASDLLAVLQSTRKYFQVVGQRDPNISRPGLLGTQGVTVADVIKTLDFMIGVLQEDIAQGRSPRLQDPNFINQNFRVMKWQPFNPKKPDQKQLRITKYAVFSHRGSLTKTSTYNVPLYQLPPGSQKADFVKKYTKQDVLAGVFEPGGEAAGQAQPLVYLTREGVEDALLEGTVLVNLPDGRQVFYNVATSNGIAFVHGVPQQDQRRYWYFRPVQGIHGYGPVANAGVDIKPGVTFAGDVINIGLGRIIAMEYGQGQGKQIKLGVLADTGGAFLPNLHQLDYLSGIFPDKATFKQHIRQLPTYAQAYILVKK